MKKILAAFLAIFLTAAPVFAEETFFLKVSDSSSTAFPVHTIVVPLGAFTDNLDGTVDFDFFPSAGGTVDGEIIIDDTDTEALLIRKDADAADVFIFDSSGQILTIGNISATEGRIYWSDPDVAHGITTQLPTDIIGAAYPHTIDKGGMVYVGITSNAAEITTFLEAFSSVAKDAGVPYLKFRSGVKSGTDVTDIAATAILAEFNAGSTARGAIHGDGGLTWGLDTTSFTRQAIGGVTPLNLFTGQSAAESTFTLFRDQNSSGSATLLFGSGRAAFGTPTIVQDGDTIGTIDFSAADGVDYTSLGAGIIAIIDGTPGSNDMPTKLNFYTTPDGSAAYVLALTLEPDQDALFAGNVQADTFSSSDGSQGLTTSCGSTTTLTVKDGLITACA